MASSRPGSSKTRKLVKPRQRLPHSDSDSYIVDHNHSSKCLRSSASGPGLDTFQHQDGLAAGKWHSDTMLKLPPIVPTGAYVGGTPGGNALIPAGATPQHMRSGSLDESQRRKRHKSNKTDILLGPPGNEGQAENYRSRRTSRRHSCSDSIESPSGHSRTSSFSSTHSCGDDSFKSSHSEEAFVHDNMRRRAESHGNIPVELMKLQPLYEGPEVASSQTLPCSSHTHSYSAHTHPAGSNADPLPCCTFTPQSDHAHTATPLSNPTHTANPPADHAHTATSLSNTIHTANLPADHAHTATPLSNPTHTTNLPADHAHITKPPSDTIHEPAPFHVLMSAQAEEESFPSNNLPPTQETIEGAPLSATEGFLLLAVEGAPLSTIEGSPLSTIEGSPLQTEETIEGAPLSAIEGSPLPTEETIEGAGLYAPNINRLPDSTEAEIQQAEDRELRNFTDTVQDTTAMLVRDTLDRTKAQYSKVINRYREQVATLQKEHEAEKRHLLRQIDMEKRRAQEGVALQRQMTSQLEENGEELKIQVKTLQSMRQQYEGKRQQVEVLRRQLHQSEEELGAVRKDMVRQNKKVSKLVPAPSHWAGRGQEKVLSEMGETQAYLDILSPHMPDENRIKDMTKQLRQLKKRPFTTGMLHKEPDAGQREN